jgi:hypothetical protein
MNISNMSKQYPSDGFTREVNAEDLVSGNVLRMLNSEGAQSVFSDCVISKIEGNVVRLNRPMVWSNGQTHVENFTVFNSSIIKNTKWKIVLAANGEPYNMTFNPS